MRIIKVSKEILTTNNLRNDKELYQKIKDELIVNSKEAFTKYYDLNEDEYKKLVELYQNTMG